MVIKETYSAPRIRELNFDECWNFVSIHILKDIALKGIPDEKIPAKEITDDILNMICTKYANLSPVEVALALQMDRYGEFENKEKHYMFYGTEYIANILKMYCQYKIKIAKEHQLTRSTPQIEVQIDEEQINQEYLDTILYKISRGIPFHEVPAYRLYEQIPKEFKLSEQDRYKLYQRELKRVNAEFRSKTTDEENNKAIFKQLLQEHKKSATERAKIRCANILTCRWLKSKYHLTTLR